MTFFPHIPKIRENWSTMLRDHGFLVLDRFFSDRELAPVIDELMRATAQRVRELGQADLAATFSGRPFDTGLAEIGNQLPALIDSLAGDCPFGPAVLSLMQNRRLLDTVEELCGGELVASIYRLRPKVPGHELGPVPWHQDAAYMEAHCDQSRILSVWTALSEATIENGCLWLLPGGHRFGLLPHARRSRNRPGLVIPQRHLPSGKSPVPAPVMRGGVILFTNLTPHASASNETGTVRWSVDWRLQSTESTPVESVRSTAASEPIAAAGNSPVGCYPPQPEMLIRSRLHPQRVVRHFRDWQELQRNHQQKPLSNRWELTVDE